MESPPVGGRHSETIKTTQKGRSHALRFLTPENKPLTRHSVHQNPVICASSRPFRVVMGISYHVYQGMSTSGKRLVLVFYSSDQSSSLCVCIGNVLHILEKQYQERVKASGSYIGAGDRHIHRDILFWPLLPYHIQCIGCSDLRNIPLCIYLVCRKET